MKLICAETPLGDLLAQYPYIEDLLQTAFTDKKIDVHYNLGELSQVMNIASNKLLFYMNIAINSEPTTSHHNLENIPLERLIDYIETVHHKYTRTEFKNIQMVLDKCLYKFKGASFKRVITLHNKFVDFRNKLKFHMIKEETIIFPLICELEDFMYGYSHKNSFDHATIVTLVKQIQKEHHEHIRWLHTMEEITTEFALEFGHIFEGGYLSQKLHKLVEDIRRHIFLEDEILFANVLQASNTDSYQELVAV